MNANISSSGRVVQLDYETNLATIRFEGVPPEITSEVLLSPKQCGWIDEFGNLFPMSARQPKVGWIDDYKGPWRPVYCASQSADDQTHE